nr:hypothetical protein [Candidatus Njordarchaeota archaeon]
MQSKTQKTPDVESGHMSLRQFVLFLRYNLRIFLSPLNIMLLVVSALLAYYAFYSSLMLRGSTNEQFLSYQFSQLYNAYGDFGVHPLCVLLYPNQFSFIFNAVGVPIIAYLSACNLVAEDSGGLPRNLLLSRPISRSTFLVTGFTIRSSLSILFGYLVPSILGYAQVVTEMSGAAGTFLSQGSATLTLDQWEAMAWDGLFWEYIGLFVLFLFATASLALLVTVLKSRGVVTLPLIAGLTYLLTFLVGRDLDAYVSAGFVYGMGGGAYTFPFYGIPFPSLYLLAPIWSTPPLRTAMVVNRVMGFPEGLLCLVAYTAIVVLLSTIVWRTRSRGG